MGTYGKLDQKATETFSPTRVQRRLAERYGADLSKAKSESEARKLIDDAKAKKLKEADTEPIKGEVLPPLRNGHDTTLHPQFVFNVPSIHADITQNEAPAWWEIAGAVKDACLWMVLGAALMAISMRAMGL